MVSHHDGARTAVQMLGGDFRVDGTLVIVRAAAQILVQPASPQRLDKGAAQAAIGAGHQRRQSVDRHVSRYHISPLSAPP